MTGKRRPRGKCGKVLFFTELDAKIALGWMRGKGKEACRVQFCNICWGDVYHITSQPKRTQGKYEKKTGSSDPQSIDGESSRAIA